MTRTRSYQLGHTEAHPPHRQLLQATSNSAVAVFRNVLSMVRIWRERSRVRRQLANMGERELQDMGTCRSAIADEVSKPFWRS